MVVDLTHHVSGFCDRLRQITFCITIADLKKDYKLYFKEPNTIQCPFSFLDVCDVEGFETDFWSPEIGPAGLSMVPWVRVDLATVKQYKPVDLQVTNSEFLERWLKAYKKVQPKAEVREKIDALNVGSDCLGVHLRFTDKVVAKPWAPDEMLQPRDVKPIEKALMKSIEREAKKLSLAKIFVASDNQTAKKRWGKTLARKGYQVIVHDAHFDPEQLRQTSGPDFAVDLFTLARCRVIVGTTPSYVVRTAAWVNGTNKFLFATDRSWSWKTNVWIQKTSAKIKKRFYLNR